MRFSAVFVSENDVSRETNKELTDENRLYAIF